ncbi:hypothetical protein [Streptomyces sp. NPDC002067]
MDPLSGPRPGAPRRSVAVPPASCAPPPTVSLSPEPYRWVRMPARAPGHGGEWSRPRNGYGTAALITGALGVLLGVTLVFGVLFGTLAILLGALGRARSARGEATNGRTALAGALLGCAALLLSALTAAVLASGGPAPGGGGGGGEHRQQSGTTDVFEVAPRAPRTPVAAHVGDA